MGDSAYARAGVDTGQAGRGVAALVDVLRTIDTGRPSLAVMGSGHYANVLRLGERSGLALSTDGVGTKLIVAEALGRFDTVGIDCIAMNVNDVVCVGADPIAVLDYVAVEEVRDDVLEALGRGLKAGAEDAGVEIPGGELAVVPELIRGHPSPERPRPRRDVRGPRGPRRGGHRRRASSRATRWSGCRRAACTRTASRSRAMP